jgi:hypothetical protein
LDGESQNVASRTRSGKSDIALTHKVVSLI